VAQNFAAAAASFSSQAPASPTGQGALLSRSLSSETNDDHRSDAYVAPTLTATGGGLAATGDLTASVTDGNVATTMASATAVAPTTKAATTAALASKASGNVAAFR